MYRPILFRKHAPCRECLLPTAYLASASNKQRIKLYCLRVKVVSPASTHLVTDLAFVLTLSKRRFAADPGTARAPGTTEGGAAGPSALTSLMGELCVIVCVCLCLCGSDWYTRS